MRMYIRPNPSNQRLNFTRTISTLKDINELNDQPKFYVEQTAYQAAAVEMLKLEGLDVTGVTPKSDKRSRLNLIADKIERGVVLFPNHGVEKLLTQLTGFGVEKNDDLVDALTMAVIEHTRDRSKGGSFSIGSRRELFGR